MYQVTTNSALRELHHILSSALRTDGTEAFNKITMTGAWYIYTKDEGEQLLSQLWQLIEDNDAKNRGYFVIHDVQV